MPRGLLNNDHSKEESDMDLRIRLAVMENDLAHKERERKEAVSACGIIARVLGSGYAGGFTDAGIKGSRNDEVRSDSEKWRTLEQEIKTLQRENALLWRKLDTGHATVKVDQLVDSDSEILESKVQQQLVSGANGKRNEIDKGGISGDGDLRNQAPVGFQHSSTKPAAPTTSINDWEAQLSSDAVAEETKAWGQASDSGTVTVPNTPIISAGGAHQRKSSQDVGFNSLDDILGPEEPDLPSSPLIKATKASQLLEDGPWIDDAMKEHMDSLILPEDLPPPMVLKTGFDLRGGFKGGEYTFTAPTGPRAMNYHYRPGNRVLSESPYYSSSNERHMNLSRRESGSPFSGEREGLAGSYHRHSYSGSFSEELGFFRYGIRYVPLETDSNYLRRITISNLPKDIRLRDVLTRVRGGEVVNSTLLDTEKLTGGMTVMVQFLYESSAKEYLAYTKEHPILFGASNQEAEVTLVRTPTWPLTTGAYPSILKYKQTRCLAVPHFPDYISIDVLEHHLAGRIAFCAAGILNYYTDDENTLHLEFSSMVEAQRAYEVLTQWRIYRLRPFFAPDPCAGSMGELSSPPPAGRAVSPRNPGTFETSCAVEEAKEQTGVSDSKEQTDSDILPSHPVLPILPEGDKDKGADTTLQAILVESINEEIEFKEPNIRKPPVGLAGSKYATIIPRFSDLPDPKSKRRTFFSSTENDTQSAAMGEKALSISVSIPGEEAKNGSVAEPDVETCDKVHNPDEIVLDLN